MDSLTITPDSPAILDQSHSGEVARLREELERANRRVAESSLWFGGELPGGLVYRDPYLPFDRGGMGMFPGLLGGYPFDRTQNKTHAPLPMLTEPEWRYGVAYSQDLCTRNHLAIAFKDFVSNFVGPCTVQFVLRGQTPQPVSSGPADADGDGTPDTDPTITACQQVWDEWCEMSDWGQGEEDREAECRDRLFRHGEAILRFFRGGHDTAGLPSVRHVEPEQIRAPISAAEHQTWGVETAEGDAERVTRLHLADPNDPADGEWVDAGKFVRVKANVDRSIKRGLPDLFPVADHLRRVVGLIENLGEVSKLLAAIAWIERYGPQRTADTVRAAITQGQDYSGIKLTGLLPGGTQQTVSVRQFAAGSIRHVENGRESEPGPVYQGAPGFIEVEKTIVRGCGLRWGAPEFFAGDTEGFAGVLVTGSPFARATEARQAKMMGFTRSVARKVLELSEAAGRLPAGTARRVKVLVTCKPVVFADEEKQGRTFELELKNKVMDPQEWIKKRGRDPKVVAANIAAWQKKFGPTPGTEQPQPNSNPFGGIGAGMTPAPPGSAGGDGSSPLGEGRKQEDRSGLVRQVITDKNGVRRTVWVSPEDADPNLHPDKQPDQRGPGPQHVHAGLAEKITAADPEAAKQPGLMAKLGDKALTAAAKVYGVMVKATPAALSVIAVLENVFDTPEDMKKLGYNPTMSSGVAGHDTGDPVRAATGISTHLAATIASHVLSRVIVYVKGKLAGTTEADAIAEAAAVLAEMLKAAAAEFGLAEPPGADVLAVKLRELVG